MEMVWASVRTGMRLRPPFYGHLASAVLVFAFSLMPLSGQAYRSMVKEYCRHCGSLKRCRCPARRLAKDGGPSVMGNSLMQKMASLFVPLGVISIGIALVALQTPTEAPRGFDTPTLSDCPGSQSVSNGIAELPGDTFAIDQARFERKQAAGGPAASLGLGPVFNATACADCHQNEVPGAGSQLTELRSGHIDSNVNFANPTIPINGGDLSALCQPQ